MTTELTVAGKYIIIHKPKPSALTKGGIIKTEKTQVMDETKRPIGKLIQWGDEAKSSPHLIGFELGDNVVFSAAYVQALFQYDGEEYYTAVPEAVICKIADPDKFERKS